MKILLFTLAMLILLPIKVQIQQAGASRTQQFHPNLKIDAELFNNAQSSPITDTLPINQSELECLQKNIYFEAAVESTAGKLAVAHVTSNRVKSKNYPNSYCGVVYEGRHYADGFPKRDQCQFSWYCDGKHDNPYPGPTWEATKTLARYYYTHKHHLRDLTDGATHYYADYIPEPRWAKYKEKTVKIDTHIFYR
tara:strand:+ start:5908 stop:6489 length:582 start_codon:yes stop_codon:yes gene_type:complete